MWQHERTPYETVCGQQGGYDDKDDGDIGAGCLIVIALLFIGGCSFKGCVVDIIHAVRGEHEEKVTVVCPNCGHTNAVVTVAQDAKGGR